MSKRRLILLLVAIVIALISTLVKINADVGSKKHYRRAKALLTGAF